MRPFRGVAELAWRRAPPALSAGPYSWLAGAVPGGRARARRRARGPLLGAVAFAAWLLSSRRVGCSSTVRDAGRARVRAATLPHSSSRPTRQSDGVTSSWPCGSAFAPASCASSARDRFQRGQRTSRELRRALRARGVRPALAQVRRDRLRAPRTVTRGRRGGAERLARRPRPGRGGVTIADEGVPRDRRRARRRQRRRSPIVNSLAGGSPGGPTSSSYATGGDGLAAYASLLGRAGHPVSRLRTPLADARLDPRDTLVVLDADGVTRDGCGCAAGVRS